LLAGSLLLCDDLRQPPDFGSANIAASAEDAVNAWKEWQRADAKLEQDVSSMPMADARARIQTALSKMLNFIDKRELYNEAVLAYMENVRSESSAARPPIGANAVNDDALDLLGVNVSIVTAKLDGLRSSPDWAKIRRAVKTDVTGILDLQESRRRDIQVDRPLSRSGVRPVSALVYRSSERETREALGKLWTHYYQALVESVDQKTGASKPLVAEAAPGHAPEQPAISRILGAESPLVGTWTYATGSQQFNGVAEPTQVILEVWMDKGILMGRYRAQLPDFDEPKSVDLTLRGKPVPGRVQTLDFHSANPEAAGKIILEGPSATGLDLMLVRVVEPGSPIPRGRELLNRR
jgi:hypothetical protein